MPAKLPIAEVREAELAVKNAQEVRRYHARRTAKDDSQRLEDLNLAMQRVRAAMKPLKAEIGRFPYGPQTGQAENNRNRIRAASAALQRERRKLWKMLQPKPTNED